MFLISISTSISNFRRRIVFVLSYNEWLKLFARYFFRDIHADNCEEFLFVDVSIVLIVVTFKFVPGRRYMHLVSAGTTVPESSGARVIHDLVVSSGSPADMSYVHERLLRYTHTLKHHALFRSQSKQSHRPASTRSHAQALSVHCLDCHLHSRCSTQPAERTPEPSPSCLSQYSSGVGEHCRQRDEL